MFRRQQERRQRPLLGLADLWSSSVRCASGDLETNLATRFTHEKKVAHRTQYSKSGRIFLKRCLFAESFLSQPAGEPAVLQLEDGKVNQIRH